MARLECSYPSVLDLKEQIRSLTVGDIQHASLILMSMCREGYRAHTQAWE